MDGPLPTTQNLLPILILDEVACPYLPNHWERKALLILDGQGVEERHDELTRAGFRRSQSYIYRPACRNCDACIPARVEVKAFDPKRSQRRTLKQNSDLTARVRRTDAINDQHYALFQRYLMSRHGDGEMVDMSPRDFAEMVRGSPVHTNIAEFRDSEDRLLAALLFDRLGDGLSLVYSFFDPDEEKRSLGTFMILWAIQTAWELNKPFVYLGYWIETSPKMAYKTSFKPLQLLQGRQWRRLEA